MKKNILKFISLSLFVFLGSMLTVSAGTTVEENVYPGDIIIGNSTFTRGTWISATRASKAGSLYTLNNGDANVKTYVCINEDLWYELDEDTEEYRALSEEEVIDLVENHNIYYTDGDPVRVTYPIKQEVSHTEIVLSNPKTIYAEDLIFDGINRTVTCNYGEIYKVEDAVFGDETFTYTVTYDLKCDEDLMLYDEGYYDAKPIEVVSVSIPSNPENSHLGIEFTNQDKVTLEYDETYNQITISLNEKIDSSNPYIAFDIKLADENMFNFGVLDPVFGLSDNLTSAVYDDESLIRFTLRVDDQFVSNFGEFLILDHIFDTFMRFQVIVKPLERSQTDLTLTPKVATFDGELGELAVNQDLVEVVAGGELGGYDALWKVLANDELQTFEYNNIEGRWVALEFELPPEVYLEKMSLIDSSASLSYFTEIIDDKYILWLDANYNNCGLHLRNDYISYEYDYSANYFISMLTNWKYEPDLPFYTFDENGELLPINSTDSYSYFHVIQATADEPKKVYYFNLDDLKDIVYLTPMGNGWMRVGQELDRVVAWVKITTTEYYKCNESEMCQYTSVITKTINALEDLDELYSSISPNSAYEVKYFILGFPGELDAINMLSDFSNVLLIDITDEMYDEDYNNIWQ